MYASDTLAYDTPVRFCNTSQPTSINLLTADSQRIKNSGSLASSTAYKTAAISSDSCY